MIYGKGRNMFGAWYKFGLCFVCLMDLCSFTAVLKSGPKAIELYVSSDPEKLFRRLIDVLGLGEKAAAWHLWELCLYI